MKSKRLVMVFGLVAALALGIALAVPAEVTKPEQCLDKKACAEQLRYGKQAFERGAYGTAKAYFKQAVVADPSSPTAWAFYDLSIMYDVAMQVQKAGQVKVSGAPVPGAAPQTAPSTASPSAAPPPPAPKSSPKPAIVIDDEGC
ncbi:MAG: hypothetical protein K9K65_06495 [Desulfarculaceae bacterium]|nr:hypothetical protein [Desulfarculaceae bacterium]MCF8045985.1 hypothetical protein [Desulfarculaceae bacterium]MCF8066775.1 hypothetical protein [Desulfarculaceae bacterium]MCF8097475.1 hypothetical protein [Desulfarculaceae bacterium]MCF8122463.1 hypothetical protein [Desulfarculaceae bacterium]